MQALGRLLAHFLGRQPPRQTSIGLKVPHPQPTDKVEVLANLEYVMQEIEVCETSIKHPEGTIHSLRHRLLAERLLKCIRAAQLIVNETDLAGATALSNAAVDILPKINPYAERFYETEFNEIEGYAKATFENRRNLGKLADEYGEGLRNLKQAMQQCVSASEYSVLEAI